MTSISHALAMADGIHQKVVGASQDPENVAITSEEVIQGQLQKEKVRRSPRWLIP